MFHIFLLNHLACADGIVIFIATEIRSLQLIMKTATLYEHQSSQLIDQNNIFYYVFSKDARTYVQIVEEVTSLSKGKFHFTCLGCPIRHYMKKKVNFLELVKQIKNKLQLWKEKILSLGGGCL